VPGREALFFREWLEEVNGICVTHRQERQLFGAVEPGDDPRRPAAEASASVVQEHRTVKH
jgi:hypothetical protein